MSASEQQIGIFTTDADLLIRSWDDWLARVTGIAADIAYRQPLATIVPTLEGRGLLRRFERVLAEGVVEVLAPAFHKYLIPCAPQTPSAFFEQMRQWVTIAPLREDERIIGTIVTIEDVTARLERERLLAQQLASANETTRLAASQELEASADAAHVLVGAVGDPSWRVRQHAVSGLARHGGPHAIATLLQALRTEHHNPSVLNSALQVLAVTDEDTTPALIACLEAADDDLRIYAAQALGDRHDSRAIPALLKALQATEPNVQYHVIEALGKLHATEAVEQLLGIAMSGDFFLAFPAIDALAHIGDRTAGPGLVALLDDDLLRVPVIEALGRLGDESTVAALVQVLENPDPPTDALLQAIAALHARYDQEYDQGSLIARRVRETITPTGTHTILDALKEADGDILRALVLVLSWLDGPAVQRTLTRLLSQPDVQSAAIEALVCYGTQVTDLLVPALSDPDLETRHAAIVALGRIGDANAVPALLLRLEDDEELAVAAAEALGAIGDRRACDGLLRQLGHESALVRQAAVGALNSLGDPDLAAHTLALLEHPDPHVREAAVKIAGYFAYPSCVDALLRCCHDDDERVRRAAVEHLPYLDDARGLPALAEALRHGTGAVRAAAARAFAQVDAEHALPYLLDALRDVEPWVRYFALRAIGRQGLEESVAAVAGLAQRDPAAHVRIAALETLGRIGDARAIAVLTPFVDATDSDVARSALNALGQINHPDALPPLEAALESPFATHRAAAVRALGHLQHPRVVHILHHMITTDADPFVIQAALDALCQIGDQKAVDALLELANDAAHRADTIAALSQLPDSSLEHLAQGLNHPEPAVRRSAIEALARSKWPSAVEPIRSALTDNDATVRLIAVTALGRLGDHAAAQQLASIARSDPDMAVRRAAYQVLHR